MLLEASATQEEKKDKGRDGTAPPAEGGSVEKALKLHHDVKNEGDKLQLYTHDQRGSRSITGTISQRDRSEMLQNCPSTELGLGKKKLVYLISEWNSEGFSFFT